jgi:GT2 family glycosyltransferase
MYSIIIVFKDRLELLDDCINSIFEKTKEPFEVVLVSNCSSDETNAAIRKYERDNVLIIQNNEELGFSYANNLGIAIASGEYIVLLNNDTVVLEENWLAGLKTMLDRDQTDVVGPGILWCFIAHNMDEIPERLRRHVYQHPGEVNPCFMVNFVGFWLVMGKRSLFREMPLNERITNYYFEDVDYCVRLIDAGKKYSGFPIDQTFIKHLGNATMNTMPYRIELARQQLLECWK